MMFNYTVLVLGFMIPMLDFASVGLPKLYSNLQTFYFKYGKRQKIPVYLKFGYNEHSVITNIRL